MDPNQIPVSITAITSQLASRISQLEQENALLKAQMAALLHVMPADVWEQLTNPDSMKKEDGQHVGD